MEKKNNIPDTYAEYAAENNFGEAELSDKTADKYYNKLAALINQFTLIEPGKIEQSIKDDVISFDMTELMELYVNKNCVEKAVADKLIALYDDEIFPLGAEYGFLYDIVLEVFLGFN